MFVRLWSLDCLFSLWEEISVHDFGDPPTRTPPSLVTGHRFAGSHSGPVSLVPLPRRHAQTAMPADSNVGSGWAQHEGGGGGRGGGGEGPVGNIVSIKQ